MARINLELNELQAFLAVAEKSSFKAAAEALYLSQPALSRRIEKLEQSLQVRLLERTTRSVRLHGAYGMAMAGLGVMIVPELSLTPAYMHKLVGITLEDPQISRTIGLITRSGYKPNPAVVKLIELVRGQFKKYCQSKRLSA
jgi:DNA-binding transcriptional LysR family regulator